MWKTTNYKGESVTWYSEDEIKPLLAPYFEGLDFTAIAELAKKSIRITAYNRELEDKIEKMNEDIEGIIEECEMLKGENEEYIAIDYVLGVLEGKQ